MDLTGLPAEALHNRVRALAGWPGTHAELLLLDLSTGTVRVGQGNWRIWVGPGHGRVGYRGAWEWELQSRTGEDWPDPRSSPYRTVQHHTLRGQWYFS